MNTPTSTAIINIVLNINKNVNTFKLNNKQYAIIVVRASVYNYTKNCFLSNKLKNCNAKN